MKFYIDTEHKVIMQSFKGEISIASITSTIPHIWNHPDYSPMFDSVIDFRKSKMLFSKEELNDLLKTLVEEEERGLQGRLAIVVSEPMSAALAAIFAEEMKGIHSVKIFCAESEVVRFLDASPAIFAKTYDPESVTIKFQ